MSDGADKKPPCGLVMPISSMDGYPASHWKGVQLIITQSLEADFNVQLVSIADDVGIIQARIVQNLYNSSIVVCDISGKNPNVMLELGMRLAFDKAVIIIKDEVTTNPFDTSPIEYLEYPRDLNYHSIVEFKQKLADKAKATYTSSLEVGYSAFLKYFGEFIVAKLDQKEVPGQEYILEELKAVQTNFQALERGQQTVVNVVTELMNLINNRVPAPYPFGALGTGIGLGKSPSNYSIELPITSLADALSRKKE
jgi:hypothetical protein